MDRPRYFDRTRREDWAFKPYTAEEHAKLDAFLDAVAVGSGDRVLEPGCGTGRLTCKLSKRVGDRGRVVAVDPSAGMIEEARKRTQGLENVTLLHMPVEGLRARPEDFDAVFCLCVFPHFEDKAGALGLFRRVLTPSGTLTLAHLEGSRILNRMHRDVGGAVRGDRIPAPAEMERLFTGAGFRILSLRDDDDGYLLLARPAKHGGESP